ncbi:MAG: helix-hairpin-helix domain-containing protein [Ktedonobacteraceae bacterium]
MSLLPQQSRHSQASNQHYQSNQNHISQQQTIPQPVVTPLTPPPGLLSPDTSVTASRRKRMLVKPGVFLFVPLLVGVFVVIWYTAPPTTISGNNSTQNFSSSSSSTSTSFSSTPATSYGSSSGDIQVYIVGAVKHPGVYTLSSDARIYQLIQAAGGPLPEANLVAINLAAKLTDGEEIYVTVMGEIPPTYMGGVPGPASGNGTGNGTPSSGSTGQLVNINTASVDQLRTELHVSSTTANAIVNYRLQNGPYTSIDQLLQVVSKEIYDHIQNQVTV